MQNEPEIKIPEPESNAPESNAPVPTQDASSVQVPNSTPSPSPAPTPTPPSTPDEDGLSIEIKDEDIMPFATAFVSVQNGLDKERIEAEEARRAAEKAKVEEAAAKARAGVAQVKSQGTAQGTAQGVLPTQSASSAQAPVFQDDVLSSPEFQSLVLRLAQTDEIGQIDVIAKEKIKAAEAFERAWDEQYDAQYEALYRQEFAKLRRTRDDKEEWQVFDRNNITQEKFESYISAKLNTSVKDAQKTQYNYNLEALLEKAKLEAHKKRIAIQESEAQAKAQAQAQEAKQKAIRDEMQSFINGELFKEFASKGVSKSVFTTAFNEIKHSINYYSPTAKSTLRTLMNVKVQEIQARANDAAAASATPAVAPPSPTQTSISNYTKPKFYFIK